MNTMKKKFLVVMLLAVFATCMFGGRAVADQKRHPGPPPEAYAACEGKSAGDLAGFVDPRGETVSGTCEPEGDRLVLRPDRSQKGEGGRHHGPPPEAYTACEGKSAGDLAQFVDPRGETVSGTCVPEGDRLVLRPDRSRQGSDGGSRD